MQLPVRTVRTLCAAVCALLLPVGLSACSSSPSATSTSTTLPGTTKDISKTACALMSPAEVKSIMGATVGTPTAVVDKTVTTCRYKAPKLSQTVLIEYQLDATGTSFSSDRSAIQTKEGTVVEITGLGDEAYYFTVKSGGQTVNTVVTLQGSLQTIVTGTSSLSRVENLADAIINKIAAGNADTSTSTSSTG
jgi:hypothetical protein